MGKRLGDIRRGRMTNADKLLLDALQDLQRKGPITIYQIKKATIAIMEKLLEIRTIDVEEDPITALIETYKEDE
jgi:hypothetical protein